MQDVLLLLFENSSCKLVNATQFAEAMRLAFDVVQGKRPIQHELSASAADACVAAGEVDLSETGVALLASVQRVACVVQRADALWTKGRCSLSNGRCILTNR
eukprot:3491207-Pleurochrysis_carterae.AAC.1